MIHIEWDDPLLQSMEEWYNAHSPEVFYRTHYELAAYEDAPSHDPQDWKTFLMEPRVSDYVSQEIRILQLAEMRKLLQNISTKGRNVGTAQTLNALIKSLENTSDKEGPIIIYTYVPPNFEEAQAPNVQKLDRDIFRKE